MFMEHQGEIYALSAAFCWTTSSLAFARAGRRLGSLSVNVIRLVLGFGFLSLLGLFLNNGHLLPTGADAHAWLWLSASGIVGFFLGDLFYFRSLVEIGPRLSTLLMSVAPIVAAITGWWWLQEGLSSINILGMVVTMSGICWVVMERGVDGEGNKRHVSAKGIVFGLLGGAGQGLGIVLAKEGMSPGSAAEALREAGEAVPLNAIAANQIRAIAGLVGFFFLLLWLKRFGRVAGAFRKPREMGFITFGAFAGPALGVALLLKSAQDIPTGIAQTLASTVPVMILPFIIFIEKERVSWRAALGAAVAVGGVVMLFQ